MSKKEHNHQIDYIEFGATDIAQVKEFYSNIFGWSFTDYGPDYTSFNDGRLEGGFSADSTPGAHPLVVLYTNDLEATCHQIKESDGQIAKEIFSFPGGRRFHFVDPSGNELAVWSE